MVSIAEAEAPGAPSYTVSEAAHWFFGRSAHWIRWLEKSKRPKTRGKEREIGVLRQYDLADIEDIAVSLAETGTITAAMRDRAIAMVQLQGEIHRVFETRYERGGVEYDLSASEVAGILNRKVNWVRVNGAELGGMKTLWEDTALAESWRFPSEGLDERAYALIGETEDDPAEEAPEAPEATTTEEK